MPSNAPPSKAASFDECATTRRKFDCVLFWALDRFTREGMVPTIMHLQRLASYGVGFHSYTEAHLATDNELARNILLALLASLAKVEAQKISELRYLIGHPDRGSPARLQSDKRFG